MATINDFKLINQYSKEYFKNIKTNNTISESEHRRLGFYLLVLECITGNTNYDELQNSIIDTEFCSLVYSEKNNDLGVDAVYIDEDARVIKLFNFKFGESFKDQKGQNERSLLDSSKFWMKLDNNSFSTMDHRTREKAEAINERFQSPVDLWKTELYLVSNYNLPLRQDNSTLNDFKDLYDIQVKSIVLDDIVSFVADRPENLNARFIIDANAVLTYEENSVASQKSYLVKLPLSTLIRITCDDSQIRDNVSISNISELEPLKFELGFLYDNVRGYLGNTKFNKNVITTLKEEPSKFFMFNNGITITARNIIMKSENGGKKYSCSIEGFQIVNGGQTIRSVYAYKEQDFNEKNLVNAEVLVRLFKTEFDEKLTNDIAEYTNSQNAISAIDLKSISNFQIQIEKYLETEGIDYVRKAGDVKPKDFKYRISMERLAQIIYSYKGYPDRATNQKSKLFDTYYEQIFEGKEIDFDFYINLINYYIEVEKKYDESEYKNFNQKYLYVVYLYGLYPNIGNVGISNHIKLIEDSLNQYREGEDISDARKLIQKGFKELIYSNAERNDK